MGSKIESKHFSPSFRTTPRSRAPWESSRTRCDSSSSLRLRHRKSYRATSTMIPEAECESSPSCQTPRSLHDTSTGMLAQRNWTRLEPPCWGFGIVRTVRFDILFYTEASLETLEVEMKILRALSLITAAPIPTATGKAPAAAAATRAPPAGPARATASGSSRGTS